MPMLILRSVSTCTIGDSGKCKRPLCQIVMMDKKNDYRHADLAISTIKFS